MGREADAKGSSGRRIADIVRRALEAGGFDGLFNSDGECGCDLPDLFPCGDPSPHCEMGVKAPCPRECGDHDWHIVPGLPGLPIRPLRPEPDRGLDLSALELPPGTIARCGHCLHRWDVATPVAALGPCPACGRTGLRTAERG